MAGNSGHGPGKDISGEGGAVRQRHAMGEGGSAMKGDSFGIGSLPGTGVAQNHGEHMPHDGVRLADDDRANKPNMDMGKGKMGATRHSDQGPHHHYTRDHGK